MNSANFIIIIIWNNNNNSNSNKLQPFFLHVLIKSLYSIDETRNTTEWEQENV